MRDSKQDTTSLDADTPLPLEISADPAGDRAMSNAELAEPNRLWSALVGYFGPLSSKYPPPARWEAAYDDDFSAEHGYEPGFEGRSEFEHGEFDRWT